MAEIRIEIEVWCSCGAGLCAQSQGGVDRRGEPFIVVEPCEKCLARVRSEGYDDGYEAGQARSSVR